MKPLISIVIPTCNRKSFLLQALKSLSHQDYPKKNIEIIVVDDHSPDDSQAAVKQLRIKNLRYFRQSENKGPAAARNIGARAAKGKFIFFMDDDCLPVSSWISDFVDFFEHHRDVGVVGGPLIPLKMNTIAKLELFKNRVLGIHLTQQTIGKDVPVGFTSNVAYRKEVFRTVGYFDESFLVPAGEDIEFKKRVCQTYNAAFLPVSVFHNQTYDLTYLLNLLFKQGLDKKPPHALSVKIFLLLLYSPLLLFNLLRKTLRYRLT